MAKKEAPKKSAAKKAAPAAAKKPKPSAAEIAARMKGGAAAPAKKAVESKAVEKKTVDKKTVDKKTDQKTDQKIDQRVEKAVAVDAPPRPDGVPADATWAWARECWELGTTDENGSKQGTWTYWRPTGTKIGECPFVDDQVHGTNRRFHPDGTPASDGVWRDGVIYDTVYYVAKTETDEPKLPESNPDIVRAEYISTPDGLANACVRYYDASGRQIDRTGTPVPERPANVPRTARWFSDEDFRSQGAQEVGVWCDGATERGSQKRVGTWEWWTRDGQSLYAEHYTPRGKWLGRKTRERDEIAETVAKYYAAPKEGKYSFVRVWTRALHERVRRDLATMPDMNTREYVYALDDGVQEWRRGWGRDVSQPRSVIEVVEDWEARKPDASDLEAWYIIGAGARAAYEVHDRQRLERWWKRFAAMPWPKKDDFPEDTYAFGGLWRKLDPKKGELREKIVARLGGAEDKALAKTAAALSSPKTALAIEDKELATFIEAKVGALSCDVMLRDKATGEAWLLDEEGRTHYWTGKALAPSTVQFDDSAQHDFRFVAGHDQCDERLVTWIGKHGWLVLQRYGRNVMWHQAEYYASRGQAETTRQAWFTASSPAEATRIMRVAQGTVKGKQIDPWGDLKSGILVRSYTGDQVCSMGVNDTELGTGTRFLERFASHDEAVRAFERIEIERLQSGFTIMRFARYTGDDED